MTSEWQQFAFGELCTITRGASPRPINDFLSSKGMPWIKIADATSSDSRFLSVTRECIKLEGVKSSVRVFPGDLILSNSATPGLPKFVTIDACIHDGWMLLRDFKGLEKEYAYWLLLNERRNLVAQGNGSVFTNLKTDILRLHRVTIPDVPSQVQIAKVLNSIADKIDLNRRINQTLEAMAQAIFKSWFVDFDPVKAKIAAIQQGRDPLRAAMTAISGKSDAELDALTPEQYEQLAATAALFPEEMEESELGEIPSGWRSSTLGAICAAHAGLIQTGPFGSQLHAHDYRDEGIPVVMPQDLSDRRIQTTKIARVSESDAQRLQRHRMKRGDIVFSRRGDVGRHALVTQQETGWLCGTGCLLVRPSTSSTISVYVSCALALPEALEWLVRHAVGATMPNLNTAILSELPMLSAGHETVAAFERNVAALEKARSVYVAEASTLATLRETLLPKLLSGDLSVVDRTTA